jgi:hypothetical protein
MVFFTACLWAAVGLYHHYRFNERRVRSGKTRYTCWAEAAGILAGWTITLVCFVVGWPYFMGRA